MKPGPKPLDGDAATAVIHIRVTARQRAELQQVTAELGLDCDSDLIRDAVNEFVADYRESHPIFGGRGPLKPIS